MENILTEEEIKERFTVSEGRDRFTKVHITDSKLCFLDDTFFKLPEDFSLNYLDRVRHRLFFNFKHSNKPDIEDVLSIKISYSRIKMGLSDGVDSYNVLTNCKITFLFDDDETLKVDNLLYHDECQLESMGGSSESVYLKIDLDDFKRIVNSKSIEYRVQTDDFGILSEGKFSESELITFSGFFNHIYDKQFKIDLLTKYVQEEKIKEEKRIQEEENHLDNIEQKKGDYEEKEEGLTDNIDGSNKSTKKGMFSSTFSFDGRIRRMEFGISFIIYVIISNFINNIVESGGSPVNSLAYIPLLWFFLAQGSKRCHDLGKNGWWQIIPFYIFWMLLQDGQPGINEYGNNPKS